MDNKIQKSIDQYVELFNAIQEKTGNDPIAISILQEITKDLRMTQIQRQNDNGLATPKQKDYLRKMDISFSDSLTRKEASDLIQQAIQK